MESRPLFDPYPPFTVEIWTPGGSIERELCRDRSLQKAREAFEMACRENPAREVTLRQVTRVLDWNKASG
jgi:hypothetical protein